MWFLISNATRCPGFIYNSPLLFLKIISECVHMQINSTMCAQWFQCLEDKSSLLKLFCTRDLHKKCGGTACFLTRKSNDWNKGHLLLCLDTTEADFKICLCSIPIGSRERQLVPLKNTDLKVLSIGNSQAGITARTSVVSVLFLHFGDHRCQENDCLFAFCCFPLFA